jgi:cell shape-determining protein MreD
VLSSTRTAAFFWTFVFFIFQNALASVFPEHTPQLLLLNVIFYGFIEGASFGLVLGLFAGLLMEIFGTGRLGFDIFLAGGLGFFSGMVSSKIFPESFFTKAFFPSVASFVFCLLQLSVSAQAPGADVMTFTGWLAEGWSGSHPLLVAVTAPFFFEFLGKVSFVQKTRRVYWV